MKLAVLDRDGTLDALGQPPTAAPEDWRPLPGALEALARLGQAGWRVVLATNQPLLAEGRLAMPALVALHARLQRDLAALGGRIDAFFLCPHAEADACDCRKPLPGLMRQIEERCAVAGADLTVIGSCLAHLQAGAAVGAALHLVCTGEAAGVDPARPLPAAWPAGTRAHASLAACVDHLVPAAPPQAAA